MDLRELGWDSTHEQNFETYLDDDILPARVIREARGSSLLAAGAGEITAEISGRFRHEARERIDFPAVGDWVAYRPREGEGRGTIHAVLPRRSRFVRKRAGVKTEGQVVAANVDVVYLVSGLDGDFNLRRIERYLTLAWDSGASPVVVLNKADLCDDPDLRVRQVEGLAAASPVYHELPGLNSRA